MTASSDVSPARELLGLLAEELRRHAPFAQMAPADVAAFVGAARQTYYAPGEVLVQPADGVVTRLLFIRRGAVGGRRGGSPDSAVRMHYEAGDLLPAAAVVAERAVTHTYAAHEDCFCLEIDAAFARSLATRSAVWADFLVQRVQQLLALSRSALQAEQGAHALSEQTLESPLAQLPRKPPVACSPDTPVMTALQQMHDRRVGSVLVLDGQGQAVGILTRHDVLSRVALARLPESTTMAQVMSGPVQTLDIQATAQEAALAMSRHGIRHLPLTQDGQVVSIVSERDLFALQRQSLKHVGSAIRGAADLPALVAAAAEIRRFARHLLAQGLAARVLTEMLSHLNDLLTERLVRLKVAEHGLDLRRAAWLAFGSEGRSEQTIATDQDNGLVLADAVDDAERERWLAMAREVNQALDACGYPLCKGNIMAANPACSLRAAEWRDRFARWMDQGSPEDLLAASIYFDFRPLAGAAELAAPLRDLVRSRAQQLPRFRKQLADNMLRMRPALNWRGALDAQADGDAAWIDLKRGGTAVMVDAARLLALTHGVTATSTRERLLGAGRAMGVRPKDAEGWVGAFEALQMFRLRQQVRPDADAAQPNRIDIRALTTIDRSLLKEALRQARELQQRIELDYSA